MALSTGLQSATDPELGLPHTRWCQVRSFLIRRRVAITFVIFSVLIFEDVVLEHIKPHDLVNFGDVKTLVGLALVLGGLALRSFAAGILHKRTELTTTGPYGLVRHPLYIGSFMMMLGFCTLIGDAENIWFVLGPILALYIYRALLEERTLSAQYGEQWDQYARAVPRFIPRHLPKNTFATWNVQQWFKNREYNAVSAVLAGLVAMEMWRVL